MKKLFPRAFCIALYGFSALVSAAETVSPQVMTVTNLYREFAFEAVLEESTATGFAGTDKKGLLRHLTPELTDLLLNDSHCTATTREICRLEFAPLWDSQDPTGATANIQAGTAPDTVLVRVRQGKKITKISYHLIQTNAGWKIQDISYGKGRDSLKKLLSRKL